MERFELRNVKPNEADEVADIETICFPPNEACSRERMAERVMTCPELFLVAYDNENKKIAGFLNGVATDESVFEDYYFTDIKKHDPKGKNIMILGLDVLPEYRMKGLARKIVEAYKERERINGRKKLYLTCLENKVEMYKKMGFVDAGMSVSVWGGEEWHEMIYEL